jgi:hypothetical protein
MVIVMVMVMIMIIVTVMVMVIVVVTVRSLDALAMHRPVDTGSNGGGGKLENKSNEQGAEYREQGRREESREETDESACVLYHRWTSRDRR